MYLDDKNKEIIKYLKKNNFEACYNNSLKGIYYSLRAKFHIYNFVEDDIHKVVTLYSDSILLSMILPKKLQKIDIKTSLISKLINSKIKKVFIYPNKKLAQNIIDRFQKINTTSLNIPRNLVFKDVSQTI